MSHTLRSGEHYAQMPVNNSAPRHFSHSILAYPCLGNSSIFLEKACWHHTSANHSEKWWRNCCVYFSWLISARIMQWNPVYKSGKLSEKKNRWKLDFCSNERNRSYTSLWDLKFWHQCCWRFSFSGMLHYIKWYILAFCRTDGPSS